MYVVPPGGLPVHMPPPLLLAAESAATPKLTRGVYAYDHTDATGSGPMEAMYTIGSG